LYIGNNNDKNSIASVLELFNPPIANLRLHRHYSNGVKYRQGYLKLEDTYGQHSNVYTNVFEVQLFNSVVDDITGSRVIPEIDMAAVETGSSTIPAHTTAINTSSSAMAERSRELGDFKGAGHFEGKF